MKIYVVERVGRHGRGNGLLCAYLDPDRAVGGAVDAIEAEPDDQNSFEVLGVEEGKPIPFADVQDATAGPERERDWYAKVTRSGDTIHKRLAKS